MITQDNRNSQLIKPQEPPRAVSLVSRGLDLIRKSNSKIIELPQEPLAHICYWDYPTDIFVDHSNYVNLGKVGGQIIVPPNKCVHLSIDSNNRDEFLKECTILKRLRDGDIQSIFIILRSAEDVERLTFPMGLIALDILGCCWSEKEYVSESRELLTRIATLETLRSLDLWFGSVTETNVQLLKHLSLLERLDLTFNINFTSNCLETIKSLPRLRCLRLGETNVDDDGLKIIGQMSALEYLDLEETRITVKGLQQLRNLVALKDLNLDGIKLNDEKCSFLESMESLEKIDLTKTGTGNSVLATLASVPRLTTLRILGMEIDGRSLSSLSKLQNLRSLDLSGNTLGHEDISRLLLFTNLVRLNIDHSPISDSDIQRIRDAHPNWEFEIKGSTPNRNLKCQRKF